MLCCTQSIVTNVRLLLLAFTYTHFNTQSAHWWRECIDTVSAAVTSTAVTAATVTTAEPLQSAQLQQQLNSQLHTFVQQFMTALPPQALQLIAAHKTHTHTAAIANSGSTSSTDSSLKQVQQLELEEPLVIPRAQSCMKITPDRLMTALESSAVFKTVCSVSKTVDSVSTQQYTNSSHKVQYSL